MQLRKDEFFKVYFQKITVKEYVTSWTHHLIMNSFSKYLLKADCVSGAVLDAGKW